MTVTVGRAAIGFAPRARMAYDGAPMHVSGHLASTSLLVVLCFAACTPVERPLPIGGGGAAGATATSTASAGGDTTTTSSVGGGAATSTGNGSPVSSSSGTACVNDADCPSGPQAKGICLAGGVCALVCVKGYEDCDKDPATGCEADLNADKSHCGSCAKACFYSCSSGTCTDPTSVVTGNETSCALLGTGAVYCWGANQTGQAGIGAMSPGVPVPSLVALGGPAVEIAAGGSSNVSGGGHACAVLATGEAFCWGSNSQGQLGNGIPQDSPLPVHLAQVGNNVIHVSAGSSHTCAITSTNKLFCWGNNNAGQIGNGQTGGIQQFPVPVSMPSASAVSAGTTFTCAIDMAGKPFCWGLNQDGKLGVGDAMAQHPQPTPVMAVNGALGIAAGANHACAWTATEVYCWGDNSMFEVGVGVVGGPPSTSIPLLVPVGPVTSLAVGADFSGAILGGTGDLWMWGTGPFADGTTQSPKPKPIAAGSVVGFDAGGRVMSQMKHACAIKTTGELVCWGSDNVGQLGDNDLGATHPKPVTVQLP